MSEQQATEDYARDPFDLPTEYSVLCHIAVSLKRIADTLESGHVYVRSGDAS